jgi:hypothetical protein
MYLLFAGGVGAVLVAAAVFHVASRRSATNTTGGIASASSYYQPPTAHARFVPLDSPRSHSAATMNVPDDYDKYSRITYGHH